MDVYTVAGDVYGIPKDFNTLAVFYNEDLFDEAGVEYPNADDDWNTFAEKLRAVAALGDDVNGACLAADFARLGAFAYGNGWTPFTEDGAVDLSDPAFVEAFDFYTGLVTEGTAVQPSDRIFVCHAPALIMGSTVKNMPAFNCGPLPLVP